ncbi:MAG: hypothetical protein WBO92_01330 [Candidatus Moraniibacteriota bacterium]
MAKKAKCFIQVAGEAKGSYRKTIPVMRDWMALLPDPVDLAAVSIAAKKFCQAEEILNGEVVHFQKIGVVDTDELNN